MQRAAVTGFSLLLFLGLQARVLGEAPAGGSLDTVPRVVRWLLDDEGAASPLTDDATAVVIRRGQVSGTDVNEIRFRGARVIAVAYYEAKPTTLASDLSERVQTAVDLPASVLAPLVVRSDRATRANEVAAGWINDLLHLDTGSSVGACVLWCPASSGPADGPLDANSGRLALVLFRFDKSPDGQLQVGRLAWAFVDQLTR